VTFPPYAVRVGDVVLPKPIAGHPALELCNTLAGWAEPEESRSEWLRDYTALAVWARFHGLTESTEEAGPTAERVLTETREFRAALYRVLRADDDKAFAVVAARADEANALRRLTRGADGSAAFLLPSGGGVRRPLHAVALAAAELLTSKERTAVRACPGDGCGWLFLDPRGRRVWCSMAACGNRAKVRAHARRRRDG
jgi:predicted RNA-binding Zn ribbon-like protein